MTTPEPSSTEQALALYHRLRLEVHREIPFYIDRLVKDLNKCQTPVEQLLLAALWAYTAGEMAVSPQETIRAPGNPWRVDFLVSWRHPFLNRERPVFVIEVDSQEQHSTLAAFKADRERDREIMSWQGLPTVRVTDEEILRSPGGVAEDIRMIFQRVTGALLESLFPPDKES